MSADWPMLTLGEVCEKITDGAHSSPKSVQDGKPMASVKDLTRFGVDLSEARLIALKDFEKLVEQGCQPEVGDVLIAKDGNSALDTACTVDTPLDVVLLSSVAILRPDKKQLDSDFLKYYFSSKQTIDYLKSNFISGAAIPRVILKDFRRAEIKVPPLNAQKKISKILRGFDDKIELNRQTNQTLEQIAQAIFKSWFVDFEPTRAKIIAKEQGANLATQELAAQAIICGAITLEQLAEVEQNLETTLQQAIGEKLNQHKQTNPTALNAQQLKTTAALFPSELVESVLGDVPEGWETKPLYETAEYINGAAFKATDFSEDGSGLPIVKIAELKNGLGENTKYTTGNFNKRHFIQDEDVLYSWSGSPLTSLEVFKWFGGDGWLNQHIFKLNFNRVEEKYFTYYLLQHMKPVLIATAQQKQTTGLGHITVADMKRLLVAYPEDRVLSGFSEVIGSLYEKCSSLSKENISLTQLRDALLPKLLSGELEVK